MKNEKVLEPQVEPQEQKTIDQLTVVELQAIAYQQVKLLNQTQQNIQVIEAELQKRQEK
jgi:hypothetical protein